MNATKTMNTTNTTNTITNPSPRLAERLAHYKLENLSPSTYKTLLEIANENADATALLIQQPLCTRTQEAANETPPKWVRFLESQARIGVMQEGLGEAYVEYGWWNPEGFRVELMDVAHCERRDGRVWEGL